MNTPSIIPPSAPIKKDQSTPPALPTAQNAATGKNKFLLPLIGIVAVLSVSAISVYAYLQYKTPKPTPAPTVVINEPAATTTEILITQAASSEYKKMTEEEYNQAFKDASTTTTLLTSNFTSIDGLFLKLEDDELSVRVPATIPNINLLAEEDTAIYFTSITDTKGVNIFDTESAFENKLFFNKIELYEEESPALHLSGSRRAHILADFRSSEIDRAEGEVILNLPVGLSSTSLTASELHQPKQGIGTITLVGWDLNELSPDRFSSVTTTQTKIIISYKGVQKRVLSIDTYNAAGEKIDTAPISHSSNEDAKTEIYYTTTKEQPAFIQVIEADHVFTKTIPFSLKNSNFVPEEATTIDEAVKKAVIEGAVLKHEAFSSGDISKIREYVRVFAGATDHAAELKKFEALSDKEVLDTMKMIDSLSNLGTSSEMRAALLSEKTSWRWVSPTTIEFTYRPDQNGRYTQTLQKGTDGNWY